MFEGAEINTEEAFLIGVIKPGILINNVKEQLDELELLAETAGAKVIAKITQKVSKINPATFIGKGKAKQIIDQAKELGIKIIIFDDELSPAQIKNYHRLSKGIKVIDRSNLILDIFKKHARTKESITQVELAYLEYLLPRLTRQWTHLERQMGGIGTRAGMGETQIEVDRRIIRQRISNLKKNLIKFEKQRDTKSLRRESEFRVSLVGYTNAGKSTLFKALTGSNVYIKNQLFATLDTTVRKLYLNNKHKILLSDTVGFIRKLPHNLVASFKSTFKEVLEADLIVVVLDISSSQIQNHLDTIHKVIKEMNADKIQTLNVLNKVDLLTNSNTIQKVKRSIPRSVIISAKRQLKLSELRENIITIMEKNYKTIDIKLKYNDGKNIASAQNGVEVIHRKFKEDFIELRLRGSKQRINQILKKS